jgi:lysophospholipid acyltransferase (LPLAT)-like uncharacterized protein
MDLASQPPPASSRTRKSGVVVPHAPRWYQRAAAWLIFLLVRAWALSLRYRWDDWRRLGIDLVNEPVICCAWHDRLGLSMEAYRVLFQKYPRTGLAAMVSASRDGGLLTAILERFRVQPVRGSSSRRGPQALLELTTWAERGYDLAITPDGPRGPCCVVSPGVISLAQVTGLPILPFSFRARRKIRLKSWDRFQVPLPFSHCDMRLAPLLRVPREASDAEREALRLKLEQTLKDISVD